jgi:MFS family permease
VGLDRGAARGGRGHRGDGDEAALRRGILIRPPADATPSGWRTVAAATALNAPLGSLYAFSVFLRPLEALLGLGRAELALVFAMASGGFGAGMMLAPYAFGRASTPLLVLSCALAGALGIGVAATAGGFVQLALGYGVVFGLGGGAAYIVAQQAVNLAVTRHRGLVNGYVVALYPAGAMIAAPVFGWSIQAFGVRATLGGLAGVLAVSGSLAAWLIARAHVTLGAAVGAAALDEAERRRAEFWRLWIVFFLAASAGLMVLSQSAAIITAYGGAPALAVYGTTFLAGCIAVARLGGGWMVDWLTIPAVAVGAHAVALIGNLALTLWPGPGVAVLSLTLVGLGYGVISGLTAAAVAVYWRRALYGRIASRIYLGWCAAAIILPVTAGYLFDVTKGYAVAILIAGGGNALGILVALGLPHERVMDEPARAGRRPVEAPPLTRAVDDRPPR